MGNTLSGYGIRAYESFFSDFNEREKKADTLKIGTKTDRFQRTFDVFMENFLINDEMFQASETKGIVLAQICYLYNLSVNNLSGDLSHCFLRSFEDDDNPKDLLSSYLELYNKWDGSQFYSWNDSESTWSPILKDNINCTPYIKRSGINAEMTFNPEYALDGMKALNDYRQRFLQSITEFETSDEFQSLLTRIEGNKFVFNQIPHIIPLKTTIFNVKKGYTSQYKSKHHFTVRLGFDLPEKVNSLAKEYIKHLKCEKEGLANLITCCGSLLKPIITVITGSGNSELRDIICNIYGPYSATQNDYESKDHNVVRTCFFDHLPTEEEVAKHPCKHLVIVTNTNLCKSEYGDRKVQTLHFVKSTDTHYTERMNNDLDLGSLLRWSFKHYNPRYFGKQ